MNARPDQSEPTIPRPPWFAHLEPEPFWRRWLLTLAGRRRGWRYDPRTRRYYAASDEDKQ